jgi:hypothetical protein
VVYKSENAANNPQLFAFNVTGTTLGTVGTPQTGEVSGTSNAVIIVKIDTLKFAYVTSQNHPQAGTVTAGTMALTLGASVGLVNTGNVYSILDIVSPATGVIAITYPGGATTGNFVVGTVAANVITLGTDAATASIGNLAWNNVGGATVIDANNVLTPSNSGRLQVFNFTGTTLNTSYEVAGSTGIVSGIQHCSVKLAGYWINFSVSNVSANVLNNLMTVLGMSYTFLGIVSTTTARNSQAPVLIKGTDSNQTGIITGQHYIPNGNGGLTMDSSGSMVGKNSTSIIL